jgi:hypothetical protein
MGTLLFATALALALVNIAVVQRGSRARAEIPANRKVRS